MVKSCFEAINLIPAFQEIRCVSTDKIVAAETLARWRYKKKIYGPSSIPTEIDWATVDVVLVWQLVEIAEILNDLFPRLFVNASPATLSNDETFNAWLSGLIQLRQKSSLTIVVEITENVDDILLERRWTAINKAGLELAIDDFGDGFSSSKRLKSYSWHYCKFDARHVESLRDLRSILYCKDKEITIIAEQIESEDISHKSHSIGFLWQQGFLHSKPIPLDCMLEEEAIRLITPRSQ